MDIHQLKAEFSKLCENTPARSPLLSAFQATLKPIQKYLDAALLSKAIVLGHGMHDVLMLVLNPGYRLNFLEECYPLVMRKAKRWLQEAFSRYKPVVDSNFEATSKAYSAPISQSGWPQFQKPNYFGSAQVTAELNRYIDGMHGYLANDTPLRWWKVCQAFSIDHLGACNLLSHT